MSKIKTSAISMDDVAFIFNNDLGDFNTIITNCYCGNCENDYDSTIINYSISLNNIYDIVLDGFCATCNTPIKRYIETGEDPDTAENAEATWKTAKTLKELKIKIKKPK
ncbi:hypothetical protein BH11BAC3_BH11BAC3_24680 [soil metagenome]